MAWTLDTEKGLPELTGNPLILLVPYGANQRRGTRITNPLLLPDTHRNILIVSIHLPRISNYF